MRRSFGPGPCTSHRDDTPRDITSTRWELLRNYKSGMLLILKVRILQAAHLELYGNESKTSSYRNVAEAVFRKGAVISAPLAAGNLPRAVRSRYKPSTVTTKNDQDPARGVLPARQRRAQKTRDAVLDAASELLSSIPLNELSLTRIIERAGCSNGAFYKRFRNKEALLRAVYARFAAQCQALIAEELDVARWRDRKPAALFDRFAVILVELYERRGGLMRAFLQQSTREPEYRRGGVALMNRASEAFYASLVAAAGCRRSKKLADETRFAVRVVFAVLDQAMVFGEILPDSRPRSSADLQRRLAGLLDAMLGPLL